MQTVILLNKPFGVLCQFSGDDPALTLAGYVKNQPGYYPAGRLDKKSEGLVLLTDQGKLQHQLAHPKFGKMKHYWVQVEGRVEEKHLLPLIQGLPPYQPAQCEITPEPTLWPRTPPIRIRKSIPTTWLRIRIQEGKNHQIRHMTAAIGFPTLRLIRYQIGKYQLGSLQPGEWRKVLMP